MAYTDIDKPSDYFNTVIYIGNGTARTITTGLETTDFVWNKRTDSTGSHLLYDKVRGVNKDLNSESSEAEETQVGTVTAFGTDNFSLGTHGGTNASGETKVNWCWSAGGTTGSSNTDGSITSTVSANTTSGFSIVSYTGTGSASDSVGHGLSKTPGMIFVKRRDSAGDWRVWHQNLSATTGKNLRLNTDDAEDSNISFFYSQPPNATTFRPGSGGNTNSSSATYIAYCFAEKKGFSKFGNYTGNGSTDGTFVYTGFKPAFVIYKSTNLVDSWFMQDTTRDTYNPADLRLEPNGGGAEGTSANFAVDYLSNGFKIRANHSQTNNSGTNYIYMAFAENPFVTSTGIPTTAR